MKKKGLIISTVVMVVVLIASLTTATYAWFTSNQSVKIDTIGIKVTSSAKVNIGVKSGTGTGYPAYLNETLTANGTGNQVSWTGGTEGLGATLAFDNLNIVSAFGIGTSSKNSSWASAADVDNKTAVTADGKTIIKAQGKADGTGIDTSTISVASANTDYLNAVIGMEANTANVKGMYVKVAVSTDDAKTILGTNAAIHIVVKIGNKVYDVQPFGVETVTNTNDQTIYKSTKDTIKEKNNVVIYKGADSESANAAITAVDTTASTTNKNIVSTFYFWVATTDKAEGFGLGGTDIHDFQIFAYIDGTDADAVNEAVIGASAKIDIEFDGTTNTSTLADEQTQASSVKWLNTAESVKVANPAA